MFMAIKSDFQIFCPEILPSNPSRFSGDDKLISSFRIIFKNLTLNLSHFQSLAIEKLYLIHCKLYKWLVNGIISISFSDAYAKMNMVESVDGKEIRIVLIKSECFDSLLVLWISLILPDIYKLSLAHKAIQYW